MRVAILGGTGSFGRALAVRLVSLGDDDVVVGSRDESRARDTAAQLGGRATGATNDDAVRNVDLAVLAVKADAALETARAIAGALNGTPLLSVASALTFAADGVRADSDARSLAERIQDAVSRPRRRRPPLHRSRQPRRRRRPTRTRSSAATTRMPRRSRSSSPERSSAVAPSTPARSRAPARWRA